MRDARIDCSEQNRERPTLAARHAAPSRASFAPPASHPFLLLITTTLLSPTCPQHRNTATPLRYHIPLATTNTTVTRCSHTPSDGNCHSSAVNCAEPLTSRSILYARAYPPPLLCDRDRPCASAPSASTSQRTGPSHHASSAGDNDVQPARLELARYSGMTTPA